MLCGWKVLICVSIKEWKKEECKPTSIQSRKWGTALPFHPTFRVIGEFLVFSFYGENWQSLTLWTQIILICSEIVFLSFIFPDGMYLDLVDSIGEIPVGYCCFDNGSPKENVCVIPWAEKLKFVLYRERKASHCVSSQILEKSCCRNVSISRMGSFSLGIISLGSCCSYFSLFVWSLMIVPLAILHLSLIYKWRSREMLVYNWW